MTRTLIGTLLLAVSLGACGSEGDGWHDIAAGNFDAAQKEQAKRAHAARDAMFQQLSARLKAAVEAGGGAGAIAVCRDEAPRVAAEVSQSMGLRIGRTSHRLRNPQNVPPDWAGALVEERPEKPRYLRHTDGRFAALLPIRATKRCLGCHGAQDGIAPDVAAALAEHYPADTATGFKEGDLRGWFWLEVP